MPRGNKKRSSLADFSQDSRVDLAEPSQAPGVDLAEPSQAPGVDLAGSSQASRGNFSGNGEKVAKESTPAPLSEILSRHREQSRVKRPPRDILGLLNSIYGFMLGQSRMQRAFERDAAALFDEILDRLEQLDPDYEPLEDEEEEELPEEEEQLVTSQPVLANGMQSARIMSLRGLPFDQNWSPEVQRRWLMENPG
jgi:hypothetical protein